MVENKKEFSPVDLHEYRSRYTESKIAYLENNWLNSKLLNA
jgi:hypothetical protein